MIVEICAALAIVWCIGRQAEVLRHVRNALARVFRWYLRRTAHQAMRALLVRGAPKAIEEIARDVVQRQRTEKESTDVWNSGTFANAGTDNSSQRGWFINLTS